MSRLSPLSVEQLNDEQRAVLETISSGPRGLRGMVGPFGALVRVPNIGDATQNLGANIRYETELANNAKEVAICTVGAHFKAKYEFAAHADFARKAGVADDVIEALRVGDSAPFTRDDERMAHEVARKLLTEHRLDEETYARALAVFGETQMVELVVTTGYYVTISMVLNAFEIPLGDGMVDPFPEES
jgi:4-carboxymuconolactone decarboxylase